MRIVVIGAGAVGSHLADRLSHEGQDVIVIESDAARAEEVQAEIDCLVIHGNGASHETLVEAGVDRSDLVIAVSSSDAVNVLAAHAAGRLGSARRIARVEDPQLRDEALALGVDLLIDPAESTARELVLLLKQRGVSELIEFADGRLDLIGGFISADAPVAGLTLIELRDRVSGWSWIVVAIVRDGETIILGGMIQDEERVTYSKVPILGGLPVVGRLFRSKSSERVKSEQVIFLTPHVFYGDERDNQKWERLKEEMDLEGLKDPSKVQKLIDRIH